MIQACARAGITIVLLDRAGRFQARVEGPVNGNVLLRREQYRVSDTAGRHRPQHRLGQDRQSAHGFATDLARSWARIAADRREAIEAAVVRLGMILQRVGLSDDGAEFLRGAEGEAGPRLFRCVQRPDPRRLTPISSFAGARAARRSIRSTRSFLFFTRCSIHDCRSAAESVGLDPAVGFLHRDRPGRPSLALDLMEELRPCFGRPAGALAAQPAADRERGFRDAGQRRGPVDRRRTQDGARGLAGAKARRAAPSVSRRESRRSAWFHTFRRSCCRAVCVAISTPIRRGSGSERGAVLVLVTYDVRTSSRRRAAAASRRQSLSGFRPARAILGVRDRGRSGAVDGAEGAPRSDHRSRAGLLALLLSRRKLARPRRTRRREAGRGSQRAADRLKPPG